MSAIKFVAACALSWALACVITMAVAAVFTPVGMAINALGQHVAEAQR